MKLATVKLSCAGIWTLLLVSLMGCAHNSPMPPAASLRLPPPPSLSTPLPPTSYSLTAADAIKSWREKQMATRLMRGPLPKPGQ